MITAYAHKCLRRSGWGSTEYTVRGEAEPDVPAPLAHHGEPEPAEQ